MSNGAIEPIGASQCLNKGAIAPIVTQSYEGGFAVQARCGRVLLRRDGQKAEPFASYIIAYGYSTYLPY